MNAERLMTRFVSIIVALLGILCATRAHAEAPIPGVPCAALQEGARSDTRIAAIRLEGLKTIDENLVREVLPLQVDQPFVLACIDQGISYLRKWGVFDVISVRIDQQGK